MKKETNEKEKYVVICPNCKSTFDVSEEINRWKEEVLRTLKFFEELKEVVKFLNIK